MPDDKIQPRWVPLALPVLPMNDRSMYLDCRV